MDSMNGNKAFGAEAACRIRSAEGLICQIRKDYEELNQLWEGFKKGAIDAPAIDEVARLISYIRGALAALDELKREGLEGVSCSGLNEIVRDISDKEMNLKLFLFSVFKETEFCHLR